MVNELSNAENGLHNKRFIFRKGGNFVKVRVIKKHPGEGKFPTFPKGTEVKLQEACTHFLHWHACEIDGQQTYVPELFVSEGSLIRDYNPTELVQEVGDILEVQEIAYAWLIATNQQGITGWIPAEVVVSVS